jgi:hypothetical protein
VRLQEDLFGEYTLIKNWGGLNSKLEDAQVQTFISMDGALVEVDKVGKVRIRRKYILRSTHSTSFSYIC